MTLSDRPEIDATCIAEFQTSILTWYHTFKRDLPWRGDPDPYHILVSEVMLQQTGVRRVIPKYEEFTARFPTIRALAAASTGDVLRAWQGLGYNRRALNLKRAAQTAVERHNGVVPGTVQELEALPGIGKYTARAVASFAFGLQVPVVDTNVHRVLSDWIGRELTNHETWELAHQILPADRAAEWNQALMDYGALARKATPRRASASPQPFVSTNRFWRGRIVDALRERQTLSITDLLEALPYPNREEDRVRGLVCALHEEGLIEYRTVDDAVSLPE